MTKNLATHPPRSLWWLLAIRAVVPLLYANAQIELIWPENLTVPPAFTFAVFVFSDAALALLIGITVPELRQARALILLDALLGGAACIVALILWFTWPTALPPEVFYALAGTWAFLSGALHAAIALPLRHMEEPQMLLLLTIMSGIVRMSYGVPTALGALVLVNPIGFKRVLGVQQWLLLLFGVTHLLFYGGVADQWRGRTRQQDTVEPSQTPGPDQGSGPNPQKAAVFQRTTDQLRSFIFFRLERDREDVQSRIDDAQNEGREQDPINSKWRRPDG